MHMSREHGDGMNLRKWRQKNGVTQEMAAEALQVDQSMLSRWERGVTFPSKANLQKVAELTGGKVTALDFLKGP